MYVFCCAASAFVYIQLKLVKFQKTRSDKIAAMRRKRLQEKEGFKVRVYGDKSQCVANSIGLKRQIGNPKLVPNPQLSHAVACGGGEKRWIDFDLDSAYTHRTCRIIYRTTAWRVFVSPWRTGYELICRTPRLAAAIQFADDLSSARAAFYEN